MSVKDIESLICTIRHHKKETLNKVWDIVTEAVYWIKDTDCRDELDNVCEHLGEALDEIAKVIRGETE